MRRRWEIVAQFHDGYVADGFLRPHWFRWTAQTKADLGNIIASPEFKARWVVRERSDRDGQPCRLSTKRGDT